MQLGNRSRESMLPLTVKIPLKVTSALIRFNGPKNELRSAGKMSGSTLFFLPTESEYLNSDVIM